MGRQKEGHEDNVLSIISEGIAKHLTTNKPSHTTPWFIMAPMRKTGWAEIRMFVIDYFSRCFEISNFLESE